MNNYVRKFSSLKISKKNKQKYNNCLHGSMPISLIKMPAKQFPNSSKIVYMVIMSQIAQEGICTKTNSTLASELSMNRITISKAINDCVKLNLLYVDYQYPNKNGYRMITVSNGNIKHINKLDMKLRHKLHLSHKSYTSTSKSGTKISKSINKSDNSRKSNKKVNKSSSKNVSVKPLSKKDEKVIEKAASKVHFIRPEYNKSYVIKRFKAEYNKGKIIIKNLLLALADAEYETYVKHRKIESLVGLSSYISRMCSHKELKVSYEKDYKFYIRDVEEKIETNRENEADFGRFRI